MYTVTFSNTNDKNLHIPAAGDKQNGSGRTPEDLEIQVQNKQVARSTSAVVFDGCGVQTNCSVTRIIAIKKADVKKRVSPSFVDPFSYCEIREN